MIACKKIIPIVLGLSLGSCGIFEEEEGESLNVPQLEPPVARNTPSGLQVSAALTGATSNDPMQVLKSRLFSPGPTDYKDRLQKIDERMAELDRRAKESERKCTKDPATIWNPPFKFPNGESFPMYFSCRENLSEQSTLAFGKEGEYFYLAELQKSGGQGPAIAVLSRAKLDGSYTEAWQIVGDQSADYSVLAIKANDADGSLELSVGGNSSGLGVGCGIRFLAKGEAIIAEGVFASPNQPPGEDCTQTGTNTQNVSLCLSGSTLEAADASTCSGMSYTMNKITQPSLVSQNYHEQSSSLINAELPAVGNFND